MDVTKMAEISIVPVVIVIEQNADHDYYVGCSNRLHNVLC